MKKYLSLLLAFVFVFSLAVPAAAQEVPEETEAENEEMSFITYQPENLPLAITLPDYFDVFLLSTELDDPMFEKYDLDPKEFLLGMSQGNNFIQAMEEEGTESFILNIATGDDYGIDFSEADEDYLQEMADASLKNLEERGMEDIDCGYFMTNQLNYVYMCYRDTVNEVNVIDHYTVSQDGLLSLIYSTTEEITDETAEIVDYVAENMNVLVYPVSFWDPDAGVVFTAPEGAYSAPGMAQENALCTMKLPEGSFGWLNYWSSEMEDSEDYDWDAVTTKDIADSLNVDASLIEEQNYNGQKFFAAGKKDEFKLDEEVIPVTVFNFVTFYDGYLLHFRYTDAEEDQAANLEIFEEILNTMEYGVYPEEEPAEEE